MSARDIILSAASLSTPKDPHWANVKALLKFDGANGSTTLTDEKGHTFTAYGTCAISTAASKFGSSSLRSDNINNGAYSPLVADFSPGTGDITAEGWLRFDSAAANTNGLFWLAPTIPSPIFSGVGAYWSNGQWGVYANGKHNNLAPSPAPSNDTWFHFAFTRSSGIVRLFINGNQVGSNITDTRNLTGSHSFGIGMIYGFGYNVLTGYADEFRLTLGVARYTSNFTPTGPFQTS